MKLIIIILIGLCIYCISNVSATTWCYQNDATSAPTCGGYSTGSYVWVGDWDSNSHTSQVFCLSGFCEVYINYTVPLGVNNSAKWEIATVSIRNNQTLSTSGCNISTGTLRFLVNVSGNSSFSNTYYCWNGADWNAVNSGTPSTNYMNNEGMWWNLRATPTTSTPYFNTTFAVYGDSISGYCNGTSGDASTLNYSYILYKNGVINISGVADNDYNNNTPVNIINFTASYAGDTWILSCTAKTIYGNGTWINSSNITIYNNIPLSYANIVPINGTASQVLNMNCSFNDLDNDSATISYIIYKNGILNSTGTLLELSNLSTQENTTSWITDAASPGYITWTNPTRAQSYDASYATVAFSTNASNGKSTNLTGTNFGFNLSSTATIQGIMVTSLRKFTSSNTAPRITDMFMYLLKNNVTGGNDKANKTLYVVTAGFNQTYGGPTDLWGLTWTPADINNDTFGIRFAINKTTSSTTARTASLDYMGITVYYTDYIPVYSPNGTNINVANITSGLVAGDNWTLSCTAIDSNGGVGISENVTTTITNIPVFAASNISLTASSVNNYSTDNISVTYGAENFSGIIYNTTDWRRNGTSIALLNMPFNLNVSSTTAGAIRDYSTNLNNGTLGSGTASKAPVWTSAGTVGGAYVFDGVNDHINISNTIILNQSFTISVWFNARNLKKSSQGIIYRGKSGQPFFGIRFDNASQCGANTGEVNFRINSVDNQEDFACGISINNWHHAVMVVGPRSATGLKAYIDGALNFTADTSTIGTLLSTNFLYIGYNERNTAFFNGSIDQVEIYNRSLSDAEVLQLYNDEVINHPLSKIVSDELIAGDNWTVAVTSTDTNNDTSTILSNNIIINAVQNQSNQSNQSNTTSLQIPYPRSTRVLNITFKTSQKFQDANGSDMFPITCAANNILYTTWGDGGGFGGSNTVGRTTVGWGSLTGDNAPGTRQNVNGGFNATYTSSFDCAAHAGCGKIDAVFSVNNILYGSFSNQTGGGWIVWSTDLGQTWSNTTWKFPIGTPSQDVWTNVFLQTDCGYANNDGYAYLTLMPSSNATDLYLMRAPINNITNNASWQYYNSTNPNNPTWGNGDTMQPIFHDNNSVNSVGFTYNAYAKKYLLSSGFGNASCLGIFESEHPWGPWYTIYYDNNWLNLTGADNTTYLLTAQFVNKWTGIDENNTLYSWMSVNPAIETEPYTDKFTIMKTEIILNQTSCDCPTNGSDYYVGGCIIGTSCVMKGGKLIMNGTFTINNGARISGYSSNIIYPGMYYIIAPGSVIG